MLGKPRQDRERVIIAFDLDNFYVACERIKNPSLNGRPVGIKQKTILATCSYEARALGVTKLCLVSDARRVCPEIIIVNGEDLTSYRMFSRRIWKLVKAQTWGNIEKLGMDELFLDATAMLEAHMHDLSAQADYASSSKVFFNLNPRRIDPSDRSKGFYYEPGTVAGHSVPSDVILPGNSRYSIASHLAKYLRDTIHAEIGFTTSAGIASSKLLAKLLASINKPAQQSCWCSENSHDRALRAIEEATFLAPYKIASIPGYGFRTQKVIRHHLFGEPLPTSGLWTDAEPGHHPYEGYIPVHSGVEELQMEEKEQMKPLTVEMLREQASLAQLKQWFDVRLGQRLWDLLWARDNEEVSDAPEFPATISVEDSFLTMLDEKEAIRNLYKLAHSLLSRLELELVEEPAAEAMRDANRFVRYPKQVRLTIRIDRDARASLSVASPSEIFDLNRPRQRRSELLVDAALMQLWKQLLKGKDVTSLRIINIAAVNFTQEEPPKDVRKLFSDQRAAPRKREAYQDCLTLSNLDQAAFDELPEDIRNEIKLQLGFSVKKAKVKAPIKGLIKCDWPGCNSSVMGFALESHIQWHRKQK